MRVRVSFLNIYEVALPQHTYTARIFFEASWVDASLTSADAAETAPIDLWPRQCPFERNASRRWCPRLTLNNLFDTKDREEWYSVFTRSADGSEELPAPVVVYRLKVIGTFTNRFLLHSFPFDSIPLSIDVISLLPRNAGCTMVPNSNPRYSSVANTAAFNMDGEYRLDAPLAVVERYSDPKDSSTGTVYKLVHFQAWLHRRPHFYLYNVYSPNCLLVCIGLASLCLPSENVSDRVQIVLTLLLSAIAYKIYVGDHLPRLSYITELDAYVTLCMATLAALAFGCFGAFLCAFDRHASLAGRSLPAWVLAADGSDWAAAGLGVWLCAHAALARRVLKHCQTLR